MKELKKALRKEILSLRRALSIEDVKARSGKIIANLREGGLLEKGELFALYASADGEVDTRPLFESLKEAGKKVALPTVRGKGPFVDFFLVEDYDDLVVSGFGIPEPDGSGPGAAAEDFDFILVPGVGFDGSGGRLGYGMGCYDRILERMKAGASMVGIGYDFQLVENIPMEEHDVPLTAVVVERGILLPE